MGEKRHLGVLSFVDHELEHLELIGELTRAGHNVRSLRVSARADLEAALDRAEWDVITCDWALAEFGALDVLEVMRAKRVDTGLIVVCSPEWAGTALTAMRAGARDHLVKGDFGRLVPAIEREVSDARGRAAQRGLEAELAMIDRHAAIGLLTAAFAHEINNPMTALVSNIEVAVGDVQTLLRTASSDQQRLEELLPGLHDARAGAWRVREILGELGAVCGAVCVDAPPTTRVDVERALDSSLRIAANDVRHRARVVRRYGLVPAVMANEARLRQAFLSLIVSAARRITTGSVASNELSLTTELDPRGRIVITVRDSGTSSEGDADASLRAGSEQGLSSCQRIVTESGGEFARETENGVGNTYRIVLPAAASPSRPSALRPPVAKCTRRGRVLIVDDEVLVAKALRRALMKHHDVSVAHRATEALELLSGGAHFDVILCDLMMPEMSGMAFHEAFTALAPRDAQNVVYLTGGAFTPEARDFLGRIPNERLGKPLDVSVIRELVDRRAAG